MGIYARVNSRHRVHRCSAVTRAVARVAAAAASAPLRYSPLLSFNGGAITSGLPSDAIINRRTIMTARREAPGRAITLIVIFERAFPLSCTGKLPPAEMSAEHERGKHEYIPSQGQHSRSRARSMSSGSSIRFRAAANIRLLICSSVSSRIKGSSASLKRVWRIGIL